MILYKHISILNLISICFLTSSCYCQLNTHYQISDDNATPETKNLYQNLFKQTEKGYLIGHQDALAYGVNWKYEKGKTDIKEVTGEHPAVFGWDLGGLELKNKDNLDGVPFDKMKNFIREAYDMGAVNTLSWHMRNPATDGDSWDVKNPAVIKTILPDGENHEKFVSWLNDASKFLLDLKGKKGEAIPILYRPYHEFTGDWFWWCKAYATPEEFKALWQFTFNYFKSKGVHNLIYVYNTSDFNSKEDYEAYYPGDEFVDIVSFDLYQYQDPATDNSFVERCLNQLKIQDEFAKEHHKLTAIAETGFEQIPYPKWWTETLINAIGSYKITYVLFWRNHGWNDWLKPPRMHYYVPYKGHKNEQDFIDFYQLPQTIFQKEASKLNLYKAK